MAGEFEDLGVVAVEVASAGANHSAAVCYGNTITEGTREFADRFPGALGRIEKPDLVMPDLFAALPGHLVGEVGSPGDKEAVGRDTGIGRGDPERIRNRGKFAPGEGAVSAG